MTTQPPQDEVEEVARAMGAVLIPGPVTIPASIVMSKELMAQMASAAIATIDRLRRADARREACADFLEAAKELLRHDGGNGSKDYHAVKSFDARERLLAAIAKATAPVDEAAEPLRSEPKASEPVPSLPSPPKDETHG